jgi:hypothetical protein
VVVTERVGKGMYRSVVQFREDHLFARVDVDANHTTQDGRYLEEEVLIYLYSRTMHVWAKMIETSET